MPTTSPRAAFLPLVLVAAAAMLPSPGLTAGVNPPGFPAYAPGEYRPADLGPKEPELVVEFPGGASGRGLVGGTARVSLLINAEGTAVDSLVTGCTDKAFGAALLDRAKDLKFQAAKFKGAAVPSRYDLGYNFKTDSVTVDPMDAKRAETNKKVGGKLAYSPVMEKNLDHPLEFLAASYPRLPADYQPADASPVRVFVTFYVDETGRVRTPNVESAASPTLIASAIDTVLQWSFKPPLVKGQPALVFAGRPVRFIPPAK
jgi:TonB family protein